MDQVGQIREKIDLVSYIAEFIPLKKAGSNFKAPCPFHNEKTASLFVSPGRQIWKCFGCQKGGDVYTFLMEYEHIEFIEALKELAKRTGIGLEQFRYDSQAGLVKDKIYALNTLASEFYHYVLTKHPAGNRALSYLLEERGITKELMNTFMLGFSPPSGVSLANYLLNKKSYAKKDLVEAGLGIEKRGGIVDFFRSRVMFPLYDHRGNCIGFSARILTDSLDIPKYVNTRETMVYHKGNVFYGLNIAKEEIKKTNRALVVEGEFDVISCYHNGITNAIAVKGTAFTDAQARLLSRFAQKITLCFDKDSAGQNAIIRSIPHLEKYGFTITVCLIPNGKDPDESFKNDPYALKKALKEDVNVYDYLLASALETYDKTTAEGKKKITNELLVVYSGIQNEIVKEHYLKKLSFELDTSYESLMRELEKQSKAQIGVEKTVSHSKKSREEILEEYLIALIVQSSNSKQIIQKAASVLEDVIDKQKAHQKIFHHLVLYSRQVDKFDASGFAKILPSELLDAYNTCFVLPLPTLLEDTKYMEEAEKVAKELRIVYLRSKIKELGEKIKEKEKNGTTEELENLQAQFSALVSRLQKK